MQKNVITHFLGHWNILQLLFQVLLQNPPNLYAALRLKGDNLSLPSAQHLVDLLEFSYLPLLGSIVL